MYGTDFKAFVIRVFGTPWIRGLLYYSILLLGSFCLFAGISLVVRDGEAYRLIGWGYIGLGSIAIASTIKFQGWFFPKTENTELKQPTNIIARVAHTARSILLLMVFYFMYLLFFVIFYITHFSFIHHLRWIDIDGNETVYEWCPFGDHTHNFATETSDLIALYPLAMAIVSTIAFNHTNRVVRLILFLLPIVCAIFFVFLHISCSSS
jgi:hypothetical protein